MRLTHSVDLKLQSPERQLWDILIWEQAIAVLTSPYLQKKQER